MALVGTRAPAPAEPPLSSEVSALARGLALLQAVGAAASPLGNRELATATGIPKATVSRLTATLVSCGYLRQPAGSERFSLGPALLDLGNRYLQHFDLRSVARPHLAALADAVGASVHLGVRDGLDVLVIETLRPHTALITSRIDVGARMSIATSAAGRAYLAILPADEQRELLEQLQLASGENWAALEPRIRAALDEHARLGFCTSFGEWHPHIHALGFALLGPRGERYAVSCGGPAYLLPREVMMEKVAPQLLRAMQLVAGELGAPQPVRSVRAG